jgi:N-acetylglucosamine malate deacetylase 1
MSTVNLGRILFLSVHQDDECLSAGGTLLQAEDLHIMYFNDHHPQVKDEVYAKEADRVRVALGCTTSYSECMDVNNLDSYPISTYVSEIESVIDWVEPDTLITLFPSYNQDHRVIYEAALTASRPHDKNWYVRNVLLAEQPETQQTFNRQFIPQLFIPIDIEKKIALYNLYESQVRGHRSFDHLRHLAGVRGMQCNVPYAEAFQVMRLS